MMLRNMFQRQQMVAIRNFGAVAQHSKIPKQKDYYQVLGVSQESTPEQIKDAYRTLVKQHHPDAAIGGQPDAEKFRDVMEAFSVLSVHESRANYDLLKRKQPNDYRV
jgi:molecular chaperone DnaJ